MFHSNSVRSQEPWVRCDATGTGHFFLLPDALGSCLLFTKASVMRKRSSTGPVTLWPAIWHHMPLLFWSSKIHPLESAVNVCYTGSSVSSTTSSATNNGANWSSKGLCILFSMEWIWRKNLTEAKRNGQMFHPHPEIDECFWAIWGDSHPWRWGVEGSWRIF